LKLMVQFSLLSIVCHHTESGNNSERLPLISTLCYNKATSERYLTYPQKGA
jgi:hypothetical protein